MNSGPFTALFPFQVSLKPQRMKVAAIAASLLRVRRPGLEAYLLRQRQGRQ